MMGIEINRQPIGFAGPPRIERYHPDRSIWSVPLTEVPERAWRTRFNRMAPMAPDVTIRARWDVIRFEATPANFQSQVVNVLTLVDHANMPDLRRTTA